VIQPVGYLKLWREIGTKPIWLNSTPEQKTILMTILMLANFSGKEWEWKGETYKADKGQLVTSIDSILRSSGKGITTQNVRSALKRFEKLGFLTNESTKTGRLITLVNWGLYQSEEDKPNKEGNIDLTKTQHRPNIDLTPKEERKKERKKESILILSRDEEEFINILKTVKTYPLKEELDKQLFSDLKERYPNTEILECTKDWAIYKADKPLDKKSNARSQLNNWCNNDATKYHKHDIKQDKLDKYQLDPKSKFAGIY